MYYKIKRLMILGGFLMLVFNLTSCLKSTDSPNVSGAAGVVSLWMDYSDGSVEGEGGAYNNGGAYNVYNRTVKFYPSADTASLDVSVAYTGSSTAPQDINVTLAVDSAYLSSFNANSSFVNYWGMTADMPASSDIWSIPTSVTIPKGQKAASVKIKLKNSLILGNPYAIPLKIKTSSYGTVSTNQAEVIYLFQPVNKYDGVYMVTGSLTDAQNAYTGRFPRYVELWTIDNNTVSWYDQSYGYYMIGTSLSSGGATSMFGTYYSPMFVFDATAKCTNVNLAYKAYTLSTVNYGTMGTAATNQFTPQTSSYSATPAFLVNFTTTSGRYNYNLKFTYVGERNDAN